MREDVLHTHVDKYSLIFPGIFIGGGYTNTLLQLPANNTFEIMQGIANHKEHNMHPILATVGLLTLSNIFMTFAWYGHLKSLTDKPLIIAVLVSWGIAFFEYLLQVPANRIGATIIPVGHLKIMQEVITLAVFVPFSLWYLEQPLKLDYLWAGICLVGAAYFVFRGG